MAVCTSSFNDMSQMKKDWIASLTEKVLLSPIDLTAPVGYFSLVFGFGGGPWEVAAHRSAMAHLFVRLQKVIETFPFLGGQLLLNDGQLERSKMFFSRDPRARNLNRMVKSDEHPTHSIMNEMLDMKNKCGGPFTMEEIVDNNAQPWCINTDYLHPSATATHYKNGHYLHPLTLRCTFLKDGLVLGFSVHHSVMDLVGFNSVLAAFAGPAPVFRLAAHQLTRIRQLTIPCTTPINPATLTAYRWTPNPPVLPPVNPATGKIPFLFSIPHDFLVLLHTFCLQFIRDRDGPAAFVSHVDVVSAIVWVVLTMARVRAWPANALGIPALHPTAPTRFCTAVDLRSRMGLAGVYPGNCFMRVLTPADVTVERLLGGNGHPGWEQVAQAAGWIRGAIVEMDAAWPGHVKLARMSLGLDGGGGREVARPSDVGAAVSRATARDGAGVDCSVNVAVGADLEFDIPGLRGYNARGRVTPTFVRFPNDTVGGCVRILPRVGGTKGTANWEVLLPVREEEMAWVVEEFQRFAGNMNTTFL